MRPPRDAGAPDPALGALDQLCVVARETIDRAEQILARAEHIQAQRKAGVAYREIVPAEQRPLIVELLTAIQSRLADAGSAWRRAEARALHTEGLSMDAIAALFGVTRQRVSSLLKESAER